MRPVTDSFLAAVRGAHQAVFRARVVPPGQTGVDPDGTEISVLDGTVQFSTRADINATVDLTTKYDWPTLSTDTGTPYGQEVYIERGVQYGNGTKEFVGLGYFRIDEVEQSRAPRGTIRVTGSDRMSSVLDGRNVTPIQFGAGASFGAVIDLVLDQVVPGVVTVYDWDAYTQLLGSSHIMGVDRLKFVRELVAAYGKIIYFDYAGRAQIKDAPDLTGPPVFQINHGRNGVLVEMARNISRTGVYNAVVAEGEPVGAGAPVRGIAFDLDPASPTYWFGPFSQVPRFFTSSFLETNTQCENAAQKLLNEEKGLPYSVDLGVVPNTALEGWDIVEVTFDDRQNSEAHILDEISYPLSVSGSMQIATRKQYLID